MTGFDSFESPLDPSREAVGPAAIRAFKLLGNETRLAVLLALWKAYDPFADDDVLTFSELLERVDYDTSGNFSYHLEQLTGHFVESTADGYRLREAGHRVVRAVIAGTGLTDTSLEPAAIDVDCPSCGAQAAITYENEHLYTVCPECDGRFEPDDEMPRGTIMGFAFDPAGLANRDAEQLFAASVFRAMQKFAMQMGGLCPDCSGRVEAALHVCDDHQPGDVCPNCGRRDELQARWVCEVCKNAGHSPPAPNLALHPRVVAFYVDHDILAGYDDNDFPDIVRFLNTMSTHESELLSTDPLRVRVTVRIDDDELQLTVDESLSVLDIEQSGE